MFWWFFLPQPAVLSNRRLPDRKSPDRPPELTMEKAVNLLSQDNEEETLVSAARYIQNQCLRSDDAKKIVRLCL